TLARPRGRISGASLLGPLQCAELDGKRENNHTPDTRYARPSIGARITDQVLGPDPPVNPGLESTTPRVPPPVGLSCDGSQVPICGVDRDRRSGRGQRSPFGSTAASAPWESWLVGVGERAALVGVEGGEGFLAEVALLDEPLAALFDQETSGEADQAVVVG